jgi:hypothetical protein
MIVAYADTREILACMQYLINFCCVAGMVGTRNMSIKMTALLNCVFNQLIALFVLFSLALLFA